MASVVHVMSRNLTDVFVLMRNNSLRNKNLFSDQILDDKVALVSPADVESGHSIVNSSDLPPTWIEGIEDVQYEMSRIGQKLQELKWLHEKHLTRPSINDAMQEEKEIETLTEDITKMFHHCKNVIQQIRERSQGTTECEKQINKNVLSSLASSLQELSVSFHSAQSSHLKQLRSREEKSQYFFTSSAYNPDEDNSVFDCAADFIQPFPRTSTEQQQALVEYNSQMTEQREREIKQIVDSLVELNDVFRDLATMVADQGTVLDRIDYNLEKVQALVHNGLQELQKAERMNKKNRKMLCIIVLAATTIMLIVLLVVVKA